MVSIFSFFWLFLYYRHHDYEGYDIQDAVEAFKDSVEFTLLRKKKSNKNKRTLSIILLLLGVITLAIMFILNNYSYNFILEDIISEILNITAWVFIWEAVTIYLLDRNERNYKNRKIYKSINKIEFE